MKPMLPILHYCKAGIMAIYERVNCLAGYKLVFFRIENFCWNIPLYRIFPDKAQIIP